MYVVRIKRANPHEDHKPELVSILYCQYIDLVETLDLVTSSNKYKLIDFYHDGTVPANRL